MSTDSGPAAPERTRADSTPEPIADPPTIAYAAIYPGIGFARVGNSPDQYFLGPEVPGRPVDAEGRFKDRQGRIKRQAARFRLYGFAADGTALREITAADADIVWTVHLANKKAAWAEFRGAAAEAAAAAGGTPLPPRNASVAERDSLIIDPGPRTVTGPGARGIRFDGGEFRGVGVELGELRTDEAGRLLVLGGAGRSESVDGRPVRDYANNDNWFDDTSDGPVTATVTLSGGRPIPVTGAWVVVGPPDYAPAVGSIVTLYDVQIAVARTAGWLPEPGEISFTRDIFPILARAAGMRWVNDLARRGHGPGTTGDLLAPAVLGKLADNGEAARSARARVLARMRDPELTGPDAVRQANLDFMPQLSGDEGFTTAGVPSTWFAVLPHQYRALRRWADGDFVADWAGVPSVPQAVVQLPVADQPAALDRAAGEACVGGPFFPGIEMTYTSRDPSLYVEPHRLRADLEPGDVTKRMAIPWQADFYECRTRWWPAQRPDEVITEAEYDSVLRAVAQEIDAPVTPPRLRLDTESWDRGLGDDPGAGPAAGDNDMVTAWSELGILRPRPMPDGSVALVEGERRPYFGMKDREYFHIMLNIEAYPDFLPTARELAEGFLADARQFQRSPECPDDLRPFTYSTRVLRSRLEQIYTDAAQAAAAFSLADSAFTRESMIERLVQMAPFNQVDGAWLRNIGRVGPIDEVHSLLFHVWMDELGNGDPKLNHSNIYTDLLHSVGVYLEPVGSRAYVENERIVDSAFTSPLFQLVIAEFSEDYLPEIIGMTLYLEWAVVGVKPQVAILESLGIDPMFYSLHIGIDNSVTGHGAMAKRTVELYLDEIRAASGDRAVQDIWTRIWDGYVAFATTGGLGEDFRRRMRERPDPATRVYRMIQRKAHFGEQNHGVKRLGDTTINNWFADPAGFMRELVRAGYIVPGNTDESPFFELLRPTGPMFRVFTDEEIRIWEDWTRSLADPHTPSEPETAVTALMVRMVDTMRSRQRGAAGHRGIRLTGATPEGTITASVADWFDRPTPQLLAALADPRNGWITPGEPAASRFVTELASGDHPMARALGDVAPGTAHRTWRGIVVDWIAAGCPLPAPAPKRVTAVVPEPEARPAIRAGAPASAITASLREDSRTRPRIPVLGLFRNETWTDEFDGVPVYGNGALH
ncbi:LodA/GoxA family CTQ-dependent oxidase [Nocardia arizonensis]|uniref:LodA/GoxA family CTQ-dependent oxidase n=1 Tax=Nocardia arizonensis TaxID=1141647 RepID=UPI0006D08A49|nr:LodA/GoxA family CTQ-dependent oxidase [Nocardia arizonensis]